MAKFLKQVTSLERRQRNSLDEYGDYKYDLPVDIKCRFEPKVVDVMSSNGFVKKSVATVYTIDQVLVEDKIDGRVVLAVADYIGSDGLCWGYEVWL